MSISVICHGCGERLDVPDEFDRKKMRCPHCGVYCPITGRAERASSPKQGSATSDSLVEDEAFAMWQEAEPAAPSPKKPRRKPERTPIETPPAPSRPDTNETVEEENDETYGMVEDPARPCPECKEMVPNEDQLCLACGYNFETGKKPQKELPPLKRTWQTWWPKEKRRTAFVVASVVSLAFGLVGAISQGDWLLFLGPWLGLVAILAFLLGSFLRIDLERTEKGRVKLYRTWIICFVERPTQRLKLGDYEGVHTQSVDDSGCYEMAVFIFFLPTVLLAVAWWWFVMRPTFFQVALTQGHGYPACALYYGGSEEKMHEIATTLRRVADLS